MIDFSLIKARYGGNCLGDLTGATMGAIVALPTALAFGVASGLGASAGLYGAIVCGILAGFFGGTRGLVTCPTGPMTVVVAGLFAASSGRPDIVFASIAMGGLFQIVLARIRAGNLIHYIPYPVVSGFMTGIGLIIIFLQLHPFVGLKGTGSALDVLQAIPDIVQNVNASALTVGAATLGVVYGLPLLSKRIPATIIALIAGTSLSLWMNLDIPRIDTIPGSIPLPKVPNIHLSDLHIILTNAVTLALLGTLDSLLTSVVVDKITLSRHDSDRELLAQGAGNILSGLIGGLPGAGSTVPSVVNVRSGGRTFLSGTLAGLLLLSVLFGLGSVASLIPQACLAAILLSVGMSIVDYRGLQGIGKAPRSDVIVMLVTLFSTVFVDLIVAVVIGVTMSCALFVKRISDAKLSDHGPLNTVEDLYQVSAHMPEKLRKEIYTYTFNGPVFFGEVKNFNETMASLSQVRYLIIQLNNVPLIDLTGAYSLEDAVERWKKKGVRSLLVGMDPHIRQVLDDVGILQKIKVENCVCDFAAALECITSAECTEGDSQAKPKM